MRAARHSRSCALGVLRRQTNDLPPAEVLAKDRESESRQSSHPRPIDAPEAGRSSSRHRRSGFTSWRSSSSSPRWCSSESKPVVLTASSTSRSSRTDNIEIRFAAATALLFNVLMVVVAIIAIALTVPRDDPGVGR